MEPAASPEPPATPLPTLVWTRQHDYRLRRMGDSTLCIVSRYGPIVHLSLVAWFLLLAVVAAGVALGEFNRWLERVLWVASGVSVVLAVVVLVLPAFLGPLLVQTRFRRAANQLNLAPWGIEPRQNLPLDRVSSVQFLSVGLRADEEGDYPSYQLNLVLQGEPTERVNLIENGDPNSLRKMGQEIAAYLNVPILEQVAPTPVAGVPAEPTA